MLRGGRAPSTGGGALDPAFPRPTAPWAAATYQHSAVARVAGKGPWAWAGITTMAFLADGLLMSPWGAGTYAPVEGTEDTLTVTFVGAKHRVIVDECLKFSSVRESDGATVDGWVQVGQKAISCHT